MKQFKINTYIILVGALMMISIQSTAQKYQMNLVNKEFDKYAFMDAREVLLKLTDEGFESDEVFKSLADTYYYNSQYDMAAIWYDRLINNYPEDLEADYFFKAAISNKSLGNYDKSNELMKRYAVLSSDVLISSDFNSNPNYKDSIMSSLDNFEISKVRINSEVSDFGAAYLGDNVLVYASSNNAVGDDVFKWTGESYLDLYAAYLNADGTLEDPIPILGDVNTKFHESSAAFTKDGRYMYFTRNNYADGKEGYNKNKTILLKLYRAKKNGNKWEDVTELNFNSDNYSVAHPSLSPDGKKLYFSSDMPGSYGQSDIWYVDVYIDGSFGNPVNLGVNINTEARESFPFVSDKNILYYATNGKSGIGGYDIYMSRLDVTGKAEPSKNIGSPINSEFDDFAFAIDEKKRMGFFSSNRDGNKGSTSDDIYRFKSTCNASLTGTVIDVTSGALVPGAKVSLFDDGFNLLSELNVGEDAVFNFSDEVICNQKYIVRAENGVFYSSDEKQFETLDQSKVVELEMTLTSQDCPEDDLGCILDLEPIYFDLNKTNIRPDAEIELNKVLDALRRYPNLNIHIESHTDSRARDAYNLDLSNRRAQSTMVWLLKRGIASDRLTAMGYGESRLLNRCSNGVNCSEYEHELNRRSVFRIVANDLEKVRVQSDLNRSVIVKDSPENVSDQASDQVTDQVSEVAPTVSSENIDKPKSIDSEELKETPIAEFIVKTEETQDKEQSETIEKDESVNVQPSDNYDFSSSNTKVIYTVQISANKGNDKTLKFNKIDGVFSNYYDDNYKRYFSGVFNNENEARLHQKSLVIKGFKDCYMVRLKGNKKF